MYKYQLYNSSLSSLQLATIMDENEKTQKEELFLNSGFKLNTA